MSNLTTGQSAVLKAFADFGPMTDVALATYVHHVADVDMSSSGIRTRRAELVRKGYLVATGVKTAKSGRAQAIHGLTKAGKTAAKTVSVAVA